ncbi:MAG TPA: NAD(P)H-dependent oxidoreductase [Candidatus Thermoplasmatota archaeon]|nr:NAD(P)H-dependent oxidoreductase [Candidatus Thermoplasmatota archaeon]
MRRFLPVLLGTVREENKSQDIARLVHEALEARGFESRVIEPSFGNLATPEWDMDPRPPEVDALVADLARADGFVLVFPEYNHSFPGALKNLIDHVFDEWNRKPFAMVSTGGMSGGIRAQENLLPVIRGVQGIAVPTSVAISIPKGADKAWPAGHTGVSGTARGYDREATRRRIDAMIDDLAWWADALAAGRRKDARCAQVEPTLVTKP